MTKIANFWEKISDFKRKKRSVARDLDFFG